MAASEVSTERTSANGGPQVGARIVTVTPAMAEKWLHRNDHNRGVSQSRVAQYAVDMRRGQWQLNGEAIKISRDGEAQETMDQGRARTLSDVLKLRGEKYYHPLATATRTLCLYEMYGEVVQPAYRAAPTVQQASRTLERNPELRQSVEFVFNNVRRPWMPATIIGALHYLFATVDREAADDFFVKLRTGEGLAADNAIYVLREQLVNARLEGERIPVRTQLALIIKAWNAYLRGEPTTRLQWTPGGPRPEAFPSIEGLEPRG